MADVNNSDAVSLGPVIVTGGCGFIGSHIVDHVLALDPTSDVHVIDINTQRNQTSGVTYHTCDISDFNEVQVIFERIKPRTVFHVACPDSTVLQDSTFRRVNVTGTRNLLTAAKSTVHAFVNTSTTGVIHDNITDLVNADETFPVLQYPASKRVYTLTKAEAEAEVRAANRENGDSSMLTVSVRPATAFGERDGICFGKIVANVRRGNGKNQIGPGNNLYDFIYVSNLVDAHILAAQALHRAYGKPPSPIDMRVDGECFHVTNDERVLFWDFQRAIAASIGLPVKKEEIKVIPVWVAYLFAALSEWFTWIKTGGKGSPIVTREAVRLTVIERTLNGEKAKRVLGYRPKVSINEGLARTGKWFVDEARRAGEGKKA
ncbi:Sterol-4-alpha-carboxylate 3-dehydrogenase, decarboxylating [Cytospora mali]|uniref:Sterol-4-alpha-carboxylate 3-dehydrogenase, decarboxylating n=1 Tax=Cytospora mali TaxID=578113 RepID=A0A194W1D8_CYTMA|nr:Sterol-4-alpha-carboxylate 3-dehydrogenase, decarboxylating [Valsa mali]